MEEEIIFSIEVPGADAAITKLEGLRKAQFQLVEEKKQLLAAYKNEKITLDEYVKNTTRVENNLKVVNKQFSETQKKVTGVKSSFDELNESSKKSNANFEQLLGGVDRLIPGVDVATKGIGKFTQSALAFIATPLGLVIAAIGLAFGALTAYFKGSEEGQNNLNKVVAIGSAVFEQLMNVVEAVGKVIFEAISNPKQAIIDFAQLVKDNIINRFEGLLELIPALGKSIGLLFKGEFAEAGQVAFDAVAKVTTGVEDASKKIQGLINDTIEMVNTGIKSGEQLAAFQARIDKDERALIVERGRVSLEVSKLRAQAIREEGDVKRATIEEAIKLEEQLSDKELMLAKTRLANSRLLRDTNGADKVALEEVAKATAAVSAAEEQRFTATLRFQKELEKLREEELQKQADDRERELEKDREAEEKRKAQIDKLANQFAINNANAQKARDKTAKDNAIQDKKELDEKKKAFESLNSLVKQQTIAGKSLAIGQATVNTYQGATEILKQKSTLPSPFDFITKAINFAATIAAGLGAVKSISGVGFARGGFLGTLLNGPSHANGGIPFSVGGKLGFEAEGGEAIINKRSTSMFRNQLSAINQAGGGVSFAGGGVTNEVDRVSDSEINSRQIIDAIANIRPVVTVEDINIGQNRVEVIESGAQVA